MTTSSKIKCELPTPSIEMHHVELSTRIYWHVSKALRQRTKSKLTYEDAQGAVCKALNELNPARRIARNLNQLSHELIEGSPYPAQGEGYIKSLPIPGDFDEQGNIII